MSELLKKRRWRMYCMFALSGGMFSFLFLGLTWLATFHNGYQPNEVTLGTLFIGSLIVGLFSIGLTEILILRKENQVLTNYVQRVGSEEK